MGQAYSLSHFIIINRGGAGPAAARSLAKNYSILEDQRFNCCEETISIPIQLSKKNYSVHGRRELFSVFLNGNEKIISLTDILQP